MGWGGRALGAIMNNINYIGIDTNTNLKNSYEEMFNNKEKVKFIWDNCLNVDFSNLDYNFVLTSPPYEDIEIYENMDTYTKENFYKLFLIPLIDKCRKYNKGYTAFNISPQMYKLLTEKYKYEKCLFTEDLKEQKNGKTPDNIYLWK